MIRILIADDHPIVRDGLIALLASDPDVEVVGEASGGREAITLAQRLRPDVVLMDLRMPAGDGVEAIAALRATSRETPRILVLTTYDTDDDIRRALAAGADGYLLKDTPRPELLAAVHQLAAGHPVLTPEVLRVMTAPAPTRPDSPALTARERDVLREVAAGGTNRDAAGRLFISEATFKTHLSRVFDKLGVTDRAAAVRAAYDQGLL
ncbi:DNA-binding NarL/FixJ family response regulator [Kineosphaera limosa]|uniref:Putative two-component response regulator n=1 Tax=Kineosphaera limosa NBRC 100340 TaxID=1184609 RepID=K6XAX6_9MICO|nr:response regulator transcription factor [Kineosphaera limosa]NYE02506.1 DNA-binding NarL/FixJ family response regulator [Kineosphaera limosa]GAB95969.1 putative two-component response regulator [Kineosphaera limosa NBRC 100340]